MSDDDGFFVLVAGVLAAVVTLVVWWHLALSPSAASAPDSADLSGRTVAATTVATSATSDPSDAGPKGDADAEPASDAADADAGASSPTESAATPEPTATTATPTPEPSPTAVPSPTAAPSPTPAPTPTPAPPTAADLAAEIGVLLEAEPIRFSIGSAELAPASTATLDRIADLIRTSDARFLVIGHTDDRGIALDNLVLSRERARAVVNHLVVAGIGETRLRSEGRGGTDPVASNDTDAGRAANRRIEIVVDR